MTDASDPPAPPVEPPAAPAGQPPAVVLARGHLHPAILLLRLIDALRQVMLPVLFGVFVTPWFLAFAAALFLLNLGYAVARYLTLEYTLTGDELRVREGLLERQERRIPLDRIQDLGFESTILRRVLGLAVVLVETASGRGVEARLDALSRADAEHLRDVLLQARAGRAASAPPQPGAGEAAPPGEAVLEPEWVVHQTTSGALLLRGLTDLRLSAFVVTGLAAMEFADQFGLAVQLRGVARGFRDWLGQFSPGLLALVLVLLLLAVMAFGVVTATIGNLVQFHGFLLTLRGNVLQRRYGLLTTRSKTLPLARIQRVTIEQPWLRRLLGHGVVKADSAGGSRAHGEDTAGGWDVVVPLAPMAQASAMLPALLPGLERAEFAWQRGSPRLVLRLALQGAVLAAIATPLLVLAAGPLALLTLLVIPFAGLLGVLTWRNLGFSCSGTFLALQHGIVGRYVAYVPTAKVQAAVVVQSPLAQVLRLAELTVYVAGGSPTRVPDLNVEDARRLCAELSRQAARAAAADW